LPKKPFRKTKEKLKAATLSWQKQERNVPQKHIPFFVHPLVIDEYLRLPARLYFEERCSSVYVNINGVIRLVPG
jgi:hypothetical protein